VTDVWNAQTEPQPHTDSYPLCPVVKVQAPVSDGQCKKPITTVRRQEHAQETVAKDFQTVMEV